MDQKNDDDEVDEGFCSDAVPRWHRRTPEGAVAGGSEGRKAMRFPGGGGLGGSMHDGTACSITRIRRGED